MRSILPILCIIQLNVAPTIAAPEPQPRSIQVSGNSVVLGGKSGRLTYKSTCDLDGDGRVETVFSVMLGYAAFYTVVAHKHLSGWGVVAAEPSAYCFSKADVADVNGDGKPEIVVRTMSGDGHNICWVYNLRDGKFHKLPADYDNFGLARFVDIDNDGKLELLSLTDPSFGFLGDFWLAILKWNGSKYVDVSHRYPSQYGGITRSIRRMIYRLQYTTYFGSRQKPQKNPVFADLYFYLGRAYELRRQPEKARIQYSIAYRLSPDVDYIAAAFRRTRIPAARKM